MYLTADDINPLMIEGVETDLQKESDDWGEVCPHELIAACVNNYLIALPEMGEVDELQGDLERIRRPEWGPHRHPMEVAEEAIAKLRRAIASAHAERQRADEARRLLKWLVVMLWNCEDVEFGKFVDAVQRAGYSKIDKVLELCGGRNDT